MAIVGSTSQELEHQPQPLLFIFLVDRCDIEGEICKSVTREVACRLKFEPMSHSGDKPSQYRHRRFTST